MCRASPPALHRSIANPGAIITDISAVAQVACDASVPLVVDGQLPTRQSRKRRRSKLIEAPCQSKALKSTSNDAIFYATSEIHMRTTIVLDDDLLARAQDLTGVKEKTLLVREALKALIERESARRLARLGGSEPALKVTPRRRPKAT
jgi:Arc/MetJ family transcription regulator